MPAKDDFPSYPQAELTPTTEIYFPSASETQLRSKTSTPLLLAETVNPTRADTTSRQATLSAQIQTQPAKISTKTATINPASTLPAEITLTQDPKLSPSQSPGPTLTPATTIPAARIQIFRHGENSRVISPIQVLARINSETAKVVRTELFGEDGRLLFRQLKVIPDPTDSITLSLDIKFELNSVEESGRLAFSVEDQYGRLTDLNSVNLVLCSAGLTALTSELATNEKIVVKLPMPASKIQGGILLVSGLAQTSSDPFLRFTLVGEDGKSLGGRLTGVTGFSPQGYGHFTVEVPYSVTEPTPALLLIYEQDKNTQEIIYLTSLEVRLNP